MFRRGCDAASPELTNNVGLHEASPAVPRPLLALLIGAIRHLSSHALVLHPRLVDLALASNASAGGEAPMSLDDAVRIETSEALESVYVLSEDPVELALSVEEPQEVVR